MSGAQITLTSPDPSSIYSSTSNTHNEHTHTVTSETDSVTFNAHLITTTIPSQSDSGIVIAPMQRVTATIDSVPPYENEIEELMEKDTQESSSTVEVEDELAQNGETLKSHAISDEL